MDYAKFLFVFTLIVASANASNATTKPAGNDPITTFTKYYPEFQMQLVGVVSKNPEVTLVAKLKYAGDSCNTFTVSASLSRINYVDTKYYHELVPRYLVDVGYTGTRINCGNAEEIPAEGFSEPFKIKLGSWMGNLFSASIIIPNNAELVPYE